MIRLPDDSRMLITIAVGMALTVAIAGGTAILLSASVDGVATAMAERFLRLVAELAGRDAAAPELDARVIAELLSREADPATVAMGLERLSEYGFTPEVTAEVLPAARAARRVPLYGAIAVLLAGLSTTGVALLFVSRVFERIEAVTREAARIASGAFAVAAGTHQEGSLGRLAFQVRQTAHRLREQAASADAGADRLRDFLSDMSHQIKTPLSSLRMYQELLLEMDDTEKNTENRSEFLRRSLSQIDRMEWLVHTLLTDANLEAGGLPLRILPQDLGDTVGAVVESFRPRAEAAGVELTYRAETSRRMVPHDSRWLGEAVSNVVKNALDHTPRGGTVSVALRYSDVFARVIVEDSGSGISTEDLPHIFDRFYQGRRVDGASALTDVGGDSNARRDSSGGTPAGTQNTGLGLALAKTIVERHGGSISAASVGRDPLSAVQGSARGARFVITLTEL